jgi:hypothetical protein
MESPFIVLKRDDGTEYTTLDETHPWHDAVLNWVRDIVHLGQMHSDSLWQLGAHCFDIALEAFENEEDDAPESLYGIYYHEFLDSAVIMRANEVTETWGEADTLLGTLENYNHALRSELFYSARWLFPDLMEKDAKGSVR